MLRNVYNNYCAWFLREEDFVIKIYEDCDGIYNFELVDVFIYTLYYFLLKSHQRWYDTKSCNQFVIQRTIPVSWLNLVQWLSDCLLYQFKNAADAMGFDGILEPFEMVCIVLSCSGMRALCYVSSH